MMSSCQETIFGWKILYCSNKPIFYYKNFKLFHNALNAKFPLSCDFLLRTPCMIDKSLLIVGLLYSFGVSYEVMRVDTSLCDLFNVDMGR